MLGCGLTEKKPDVVIVPSERVTFSLKDGVAPKPGYSGISDGFLRDLIRECGTPE